MTTFIIAIILFAITYILLLTFSKFRSWIAFASAIIFSLWLSLICKDIEFTIKDIISSIDFNDDRWNNGNRRSIY